MSSSLQLFATKTLQIILGWYDQPQSSLSLSPLVELGSLLLSRDGTINSLDLDLLNKAWNLSSLSRQLITKAWTNFISDAFDEATSASEELLNAALDWMSNNLNASSIHNPEDLYSRICLFHQARRLHSLITTVLDTPTGLSAKLTHLLSYEHLSDHFLVISTDLSSFLSSQPLVNTLSPKDLVYQLCTLPMHKPTTLVTTAWIDPTTRMTYFDTMLLFLQWILGHLHNAIDMSSSSFITGPLQLGGTKINKKKKSQKKKDAFSNLGASSIEETELVHSKEVEEVVGILEARMMWLLSLINDALAPKIFLPPFMVSRFLTLADDITKLDLPTLTPLCERIRLNIAKKTMAHGPSLPQTPELLPKPLATFTHDTNDMLQSSIASKMSDLKPPSSSAHPNEALACFEGIWLQVDAEPDRLVMPTNIAIQESALDETHISCAPGILQITQQGLVWWGLEREANLVTALYTPALTINYSSILRYAFGRVTDATHLPYASHTLHQLPKREDNLHVRVYFLHVYLTDTVFRMYPIYDDELAKCTLLLNHGVGKPAFNEMEVVKYVIAKRLEATRYRLFETVVSYAPLIEHSADLIKVVRKLTKEGEPQGLYDMERLYHSCRIESEVTKETLHHLRIAWHASPSETVRFKVLAIVDRLLDPSVVHLADPNFALMYKWLQHLEETVSPYKSAEALRIIMVLLSRCKAMQLYPLAPVFQIQSTFDKLKEYEAYFKFFS